MNRLIFEDKKVLMAYVTAGDPNIETTEKLILAMAEAGADAVQIGVPFSDPVAGGVEMQQADERALASGSTVDGIFDMVARLRQKIDIALIIKSYMNPIFVYGKAQFMGKCSQVGIDGIIVPDLPYEEREEIATNCQQYGVAHIPVIAPAAMDRIETLAAGAQGLIIVPQLNIALVKLVKAVSTLPCIISMDAPTTEEVREAMSLASGISIESSVVRLTALHGTNCVGHVKEYIAKMKDD